MFLFMLWKTHLRWGFNLLQLFIFHFILSNISPYTQQISDLRTDFWGNCGEKAYPSSKRNQNIQKLIYESYDQVNDKFVFCINKRIRVCEGHAMILLVTHYWSEINLIYVYCI